MTIRDARLQSINLYLAIVREDPDLPPPCDAPISGQRVNLCDVGERGLIRARRKTRWMGRGFIGRAFFGLVALVGLGWSAVATAGGGLGAPCTLGSQCNSTICYEIGGSLDSGYCGLFSCGAICKSSAACDTNSCRHITGTNYSRCTCLSVPSACTEGAQCAYGQCQGNACCEPPVYRSDTCSANSECCGDRDQIGCVSQNARLSDGGIEFEYKACCIGLGGYCNSTAECCSQTGRWGSKTAGVNGQVVCTKNLCAACFVDGTHDGMRAECCSLNDAADVKDGGNLCCEPTGAACDNGQSLLCCNGVNTPSTQQEGVICGIPPGSTDPQAGTCCFPNDAGPCVNDSDCCCGKCDTTVNPHLCKCF